MMQCNKSVLEGRVYLRVRCNSGNTFLLRDGESLVGTIGSQESLDEDWSKAERLALSKHGIQL